MGWLVRTTRFCWWIALRIRVLQGRESGAQPRVLSSEAGDFFLQISLFFFAPPSWPPRREPLETGLRKKGTSSRMENGTTASLAMEE